MYVVHCTGGSNPLGPGSNPGVPTSNERMNGNYIQISREIVSVSRFEKEAEEIKA